jgi:AAA+ ATPase superfamily predicted ATPase
LSYYNYGYVSRQAGGTGVTPAELKRWGFGLLVIYGRRRVGKTALVLKAAEDMRRLYYLAVERGNLPRLKRAAMALDPQARYVEEDWEALFAFPAQRVDVVVIDEFPNLIAKDKAVLSTLQASSESPA